LVDRGPLDLYANVVDDARRGGLNDATCIRLFLDEDGVRGADLRKLFAEILETSAEEMLAEPIQLPP
jgi:hypothetical protein